MLPASGSLFPQDLESVDGFAGAGSEAFLVSPAVELLLFPSEEIGAAGAEDLRE